MPSLAEAAPPNANVRICRIGGVLEEFGCRLNWIGGSPAEFRLPGIADEDEAALASIKP
ncbi:hypothetical protein JQ597_04540 [Bradyrhizobium sp. AUGA SZCCT0177]|uniref:hypothetical protein n=1 Tax=Bradyrhizobium sp. AUGA SZCCT0177 TaxID=2807665 RepID=UPI001BA5AB42|nr:hypothetical protein [Bradyrhizobium sp. AUGA SZCCT0177]MBR1281303.1 hypothetical protein [Bradyrhizobium sp. AUGA SZCCT0177]